MKEIAISDIHGCGVEFQQLLQMIEPLGKDDKLILLGDYFDRGIRPVVVFENLQRLKAVYGEQVVLLFGNHDDMLFEYIGIGSTRPYDFGVWNMNGGGFTERAFGKPGELKRVAEWIKNNSALTFETESAFYVHAGISPAEELSPKEMIWTRSLHYYPRQKKLLVVGHSQISYLIRTGIAKYGSKAPFYNRDKNYIDIDNGCAYGDGPLLAYDVTNNIAYYSDGKISTHPFLIK